MSAAKGDSRVLNTEDRDVTMMDVGEKVRPPGDPPDGRGSWVKKVVGSTAGGLQRPEDILDDAFVRERVTLSFPDGEDGELVITIAAEVLEAMNGLWKRCIIVKVLGRSVSVAVLSRKLRELWKPTGAMYVLDLPRQFFMIRFELEEEYMAALTGGPWRVFGSCLLAQAWSPDFDPLRDEIVTTPVWVRMANLPVNLYHPSILMSIAEGLGRPLKVDMTTLNCDRGRFARVCVEVNLKRPLKGTVVVNGSRFYVSYEGLQMICSKCGMFGHLVYKCPQASPERAVPGNAVGVATEGTTVSAAEDGFTPVRRTGRRSGTPENQGISTVRQAGGSQERNLREIQINQDFENISLSNKFGNLEEMEIAPEVLELVDSTVENKENTNQLVNINKGKGAQHATEGMREANSNKKKVGLVYEKRSGVGKPNGRTGPKIMEFKSRQKPKQIRPTRGLVYGPINGELALSASGKRLRTEKQSVGRPGGAFVNANEEIMEKGDPIKAQDSRMGVSPVDLVSGEKDEEGDGVIRIGSPEVVVNLIA